MKEETPKVKEVYVQREEGKEEPRYYISGSLIMCAIAVSTLLAFVLIVELFVGWGPIFQKFFEMVGSS